MAYCLLSPLSVTSPQCCHLKLPAPISSLCECNVIGGWNLCYVDSSYLSVCVFIVAIPEEEGDSGGHHVGPQQSPGKISHTPPNSENFVTSLYRTC